MDPARPKSNGLKHLSDSLVEDVTGPLNITLHPLLRTFHPIIRISISPTPSSPKAGTKGCYALITLKIPDEVFIDKDELENKWGLSPTIVKVARFDQHPINPIPVETGGVGVRSWTINPLEIDIERPVHPVKIPLISRTGEEIDAGSILSLALELKNELMDLDIPLHGRYLIPGMEREREVIVFGEGGGEIRGGWMCAMSEDPNQIFAYPPPDIESSKRDSKSNCITITSSKTQTPFPIIRTISGEAITLTLPIGNTKHQVPVEIMTALVIWLGWAYLVRKIWKLCKRGNRGIVTEVKKRN